MAQVRRPALLPQRGGEEVRQLAIDAGGLLVRRLVNLFLMSPNFTESIATGVATAKFISIFVSARKQRVIASLLGLLFFVPIVAASALFAVAQTRDATQDEIHEALRPYRAMQASLASTFGILRESVTAEPCSADFRDQLRRVAFLPDGLSEFLYVRGETALCSTSMPHFIRLLSLGRADLQMGDPRENFAVWVGRDLSPYGLDGLSGSIVRRGNFAVVLPSQPLVNVLPDWLKLETLFIAPDGRAWHRGGSDSVYTAAAGPGGTDAARAMTQHSLSCIDGLFVCAAAEASLLTRLRENWALGLGAVLMAALVARGMAGKARQMIVRRWSFENRFRRHLDEGSVICAYQPIMDLRTGRTAGCEVLARWRDVDDTVVFPDRFIPVVEKQGLTRAFTRMVADRAFAELSAAIPEGDRLKVTFNIFPRDLDAEFLCDAFSRFVAHADRFQVVLEIVENDSLVVATAQREIEALRHAGIQTYIDDFGSGYSNMEMLAALSVDGVKLDRAFAMAPDDSIMARMLVHAIDMIRASGRAMVVEGVETAERLRHLQALVPQIEYGQGYHIARPMPAEALSAYLGREATDREVALAA